MSCTNPDSSTQDAYLSAAIDAAHVGGRVLQDWIGRFSVREKSRANLVTEADEASQTAIVQTLKNRFPQHGFLGEENLNERDATTEVFWIIDPLDGTSNYVHGFPYYAVSIGLWVRDHIEVGVIFDPTRNETFAATFGKGATLNRQPIRTSGENKLTSAMGMASLPVATDRENPAVKRFLNALPKLQTVQRSGSAALNLAYVASGRIDCFWSSSLHPWDVAAGALLVAESGGTITKLDGSTFDIFVPDLLSAATTLLGQQLVTALG
ncbi:MAG: inositol monophosphatase family protein [Planctomycetales bacterium]|nr:inositol monophosphatase family protein [Planctomycetales bacterium]